jgi:hypothetical protein
MPPSARTKIFSKPFRSGRLPEIRHSEPQVAGWDTEPHSLGTANIHGWPDHRSRD